MRTVAAAVSELPRGDIPIPGVPPWHRHPFLAETLAALTRGGARFGWLRGPEGEPEPGTTVCREVDLLVEAARLPHLAVILAERGFVKLPGWGHAPHHFFVGYDVKRGDWWKLDVITELRYGHPVRALRAGEVGELVARVDDVGRLAPDDELLTLLLRCLLNRADFSPATRTRLSALHHEISRHPGLAARADREIRRWLAPALDWGTLAPALERGDWEGLLRRRHLVARRLFLREPLGVVWRRVHTTLVRRLRPLLFLLRGRGTAVTLRGPDGEGSATLARALAAEPFLRASWVRMGNDPAWTTPPPGAYRLAEQWRRNAAARYRQLRGGLVVYDCYPGGPGRAGGSGSLGEELHARLLAAGAPRPDRVFVLDAPGEGPQLPGTTVIDATAGGEAAKRAVVAALWGTRADRAARRV